MDPTGLGISLAIGLCVAATVYTNRGNYSLFIDFVERDLRDRLHSLRVSAPRLRRWINTWVAIVVGGLFLLGFQWGFPPAVMLASTLSAGPWYLVRRLAQKRRSKIEDQMADAMVMFSSAIRAGMSIAQALELLANDCPKPISQEFRQLVGEYKMGKPLERTLDEAKARLKSENFILFAAALLASRESGGRLNETVERISKSVLELQRLERKIRSETAQARKSSMYMILVTPVILGAYFILDPDAVVNLFTSPIGQLVLCTAFVLNMVAYFWALKILKTDI